MGNRKALEEVSRRTGLKLATVADLLERGWTYVENIEHESRWLSPEAQLKK